MEDKRSQKEILLDIDTKLDLLLAMSRFGMHMPPPLVKRVLDRSKNIQEAIRKFKAESDADKV